jgi:hypothetical protein
LRLCGFQAEQKQHGRCQKTTREHSKKGISYRAMNSRNFHSLSFHLCFVKAFAETFCKFSNELFVAHVLSGANEAAMQIGSSHCELDSWQKAFPRQKNICWDSKTARAGVSDWE